ncbi:Mu transposase C-terminal domain-containing protein [Streptomyces clavifer]|uniref:Mu transposase C-terminal domain-containing protein n=1 Tax=Streptomyces clavifer TaxID=68188 RepID=UPI003092A8F5|nr:DDE-type integrase/transposase/recombinase [Streptomyces clavifer]WRY80078.1 DDE-type integrase/transposase/recombinase [Streptomyces clavifer]WRY86241.1 DDE-type integrase/transposase/recombinase [Streptomyces clavifer]WRY86272.1 DDE-type integrase/transposase/recombinase [Streptomyces clavifer]
MTARRNARPSVTVGAQVRFRGVKWQVVALSGQTIHLVGPDGGGEAVLAGYLFADPGFSVIGAEVPQAAPQWGLFETAPAAAREKAMAWQRHVREVECGLADGPGSAGAVRVQYDPERHTLAEREQAKAEELTALGFGRVSRTTVQRMRLAYRKQGLWGLLDHRTTRASSPTGRSDERVVAAVREALRRRRGRSKGTINGLFPLINQILEDQHGPGTVPVPSQATLYRLVTTLARPGELPSGPVRQVPASVEGRAFTPAMALRPGEQVQIDTTRLDVLALFDDGRLARPELTIAVDVATRSILAAVLCPSATKAVDAALLLAEMAVPPPARPTWPDILRMDHARALPHQRLATLDERLAGAAARPVVLPETIVVDRGKVFISRAFTAACESLGISVQPAPPRAPTAKGIVERTFGSINALFCQHLPGYTGSNVTRRGPDTEKDACYSVTQLQDLLDEWLVHYHHRPHEGLRHPMMPRKALTPNQMWAALLAVAGYVPVPLTGRDYLELLPVRWQAITPAGITVHHRTYDADLLAPHRSQASPVAGRGGKWEIHYNPHDVRQIWVRLPDGELTEIPWIHRDHVHRPFDERTWQHIRTQAVDGNHSDTEQHEASLADSLDQLMRRVHSGHATTTEQALLARTAHLPLPTARDGDHHTETPADSPAQLDEDDSIDDLDDLPDDDVRPAPAAGFGLYDAHEEADKW